MKNGTKSRDLVVFPRTAKQAFGHHSHEPLRKSLTFREQPCRYWWVLPAIIAIALAACIIKGR
jgi:hypothetical protein